MSQTHAGIPSIGRFAPSPTGDLHFGSLVAAVGSFLQAKSRGGQWLLRIEDIDPPRIVSGADRAIIDTLARFGLRPDQPALYQSQRREAYQAALQRLLQSGLAYPCACSRRQLPAGQPYPGTCRDGLPAGRKGRSIRVRVADRPISFVDAVHGRQTENLAQSSGDFVIWRADDLPAYQLAVVVDDAWQGVTEVVRGMDLLDSTARQLHLQALLGLPAPAYAHLPLATLADGQKLSKRLGSDPVAALEPGVALAAVLRFLGQPVPTADSLLGFWSRAIANWRIDRVPSSPAQPG